MKRQRNLERLISRCESVLSGKSTFVGQEWKLSRYVATVEEQIGELKNEPNIDPDLLKSYQQKVSVLREVLRSEEKPRDLFPTSANTSVGSDLLSPNQSGLYRSLSLSLPPSFNIPRASGANELLMKANNKRLSSLREQLFSSIPGGDVHALRQRHKVGSDEELVRHHEKVQEEVAEDMIKMARSLKTNSLLAKTIIGKDNELLRKTTNLAEGNIVKVVRETGRLKTHNSGCGWGIWLLLLLVFVVFIAMVIFMRIVPKPRT